VIDDANVEQTVVELSVGAIFIPPPYDGALANAVTMIGFAVRATSAA
jgi:hypothetical protein